MKDTTAKGSLTERMINPDGVLKSKLNADIMSTSKWALDPILAITPIYALNIALGGSLKAGLRRGVIMAVGDTQTFKSAYGAILCASFLSASPDNRVIFADSEYGTTTEYFERFGADTSRIIHLPITDIDDMKKAIVRRIMALTPADIGKVMIMIDSIGLLGSTKELTDLLEKDELPQDMTRAKSLNSFWRVVTPFVNKFQIPLYAINHYYDSIGQMGNARIVKGGKQGILAANDIWFITATKEKEGKDVNGYTFKIYVDKSRKVVKHSVIPITVMFDEHISPYTGLFEIARALDYVQMPSNGWYVRKFVGEDGKVTIEDRKWRRAELEFSPEFWEPMIENYGFNQAIEETYQYSKAKKILTQQYLLNLDNTFEDLVVEGNDVDDDDMVKLDDFFPEFDDD